MLQRTLSSAAVLTTCRIFSMGAGILLTPVILRHLGLELLGLYGLLAGILSYFALLDFGTGVSGMRFLTVSRRKNSSTEIQRLYGTLTCISLAVGLAAIAFSFFVGQWVVSIFRISESLIPLARWALIVASFTFFLTIFKQQINALINSAGHFRGPALFDLAGTLCYAVAMLVLLPKFPRFETLVYGFLGQALLQTTLVLIYGRIAGVRISSMFYMAWDREQFRRIFAFSRNVWLSNLSGIIVFESQKLFLGAMVNLSSVASYYVAGRFTSVQRALGTGFNAPLTRHATETFANGQIEEFRRQYRRSTTLFTWLQLSVFILLYVFAERVLHVWLGTESPPNGATLLRLQAAGMCAVLLTGVLSSFSRAAGITKPELLSSLVGIVVSIIANFVLIRAFGVSGAAWANLIALSCSSLTYGIIVLRCSLLRCSGLRWPLGLVVVISVVFFAVCVTCDSNLPSPTGRLAAIVWLAASAGPPTLVAAGLFLLLGRIFK